ncbi:MAG: hypothetical protein AB7P08_09810 [Burkholderiales bacterium]
MKTVELVEETVPWNLRPRARRWDTNDLVGVSITCGEADLRARIKAARGTWRSRPLLWEIDWMSVRELGLEGRVVETK